MLDPEFGAFSPPPARKPLPNPNLVEAHSDLGKALYRLRDFEGALAELRTAVRLDPTLAHVHYDLGIALMDFGNVPEAVKELEVFVRLVPITPSNRQKIEEAKKRLNKLRFPEKGPGNF